MKKRMQLLLLSGMLICSPAIVALAGEQTLEYIGTEEMDAETATGEVAIDGTNFPDANFRKYVLENCDTDKDGMLSEQEIAGCVEMKVRDIYIENLKGIEYFTELTRLNCEYNWLTELNFSNNPNLKYLDCDGNEKLKKLDIDKNLSLEELQCRVGDLTELDVSNNSNLRYLDCGLNELTELNVSNNPNLEVLRCDVNKLSDIDTSKNSELAVFYCDTNELTRLDISDNMMLEDVNCSFNNLTELDTSKNFVLTRLDCSGNQITSLDMSSLDSLGSLGIDEQLLDVVIVNPGRIRFLNIQLRTDYLDVSKYKNFNFDSSKMSDLKAVTYADGVFTVQDMFWGGSFIYDLGERKIKIGLIPGEEQPEPILPFEDLNVPEDNWKYQAVKYVYENGIMTGMGSDKIFAPDNTLTRAMFATILYRMAGQPAVEFDAERFTDVEGGRWYSEAIIWANDNQIVNGFADGNYGVEAEITREQIAKMLYQYAVVCGYDTTASKELDEFTDKETVSGWAVAYIKWAAGSNMISGKPNEDGGFRIDPQGKATRAECAKMIQKFEQSNGK